MFRECIFFFMSRREKRFTHKKSFLLLLPQDFSSFSSTNFPHIQKSGENWSWWIVRLVLFFYKDSVARLILRWSLYSDWLRTFLDQSEHRKGLFIKQTELYILDAQRNIRKPCFLFVSIYITQNRFLHKEIERDLNLREIREPWTGRFILLQ